MSGLNKNTTGWAFLIKSGVSLACFRFSLSLWAPSAPWAHEDHVYPDYPTLTLTGSMALILSQAQSELGL